MILVTTPGNVFKPVKTFYRHQITTIAGTRPVCMLLLFMCFVIPLLHKTVPVPAACSGELRAVGKLDHSGQKAAGLLHIRPSSTAGLTHCLLLLGPGWRWCHVQQQPPCRLQGRQPAKRGTCLQSKASFQWLRMHPDQLRVGAAC